MGGTDENGIKETCSFTDYHRTTIANIPQLREAEGSFEIFASGEYRNFENRLYVVVLVFWLLVAYTCYTLDREWIEILALRRVYYLEYDVWGKRKKEHHRSIFHQDN